MRPIDQARAFVRSTVQQPALEHPNLPADVKSKVKHSEIWLDQFERVGDLLIYLKRFDASNNDPTYKILHELGLKTFEDIVVPFEEEFALWANDCTRQSDFIVGQLYSAYQILIFAGNYDTRSGGMFVLESGKQPSAVVIKATLDGGQYPNEWIERPTRLKYYLKSIKGIFQVRYKANAAIIENPTNPILTFVRQTNSDLFTYQGVFQFDKLHQEQSGAKWFELVKGRQPIDVVADAIFTEKDFQEKTRVAAVSERDKRLARLAKATKKPEKIQVVSTAFNRNPDVVAEVLCRADGKCESCHQPAPFLRRSDGSYYLEVHHKVQLADDGDDTVENAVALCPNCHRKAHYG